MKYSNAIKQRILELLEINNINVSTLARNAGLNDSTIRSILNKKCDSPKAITIHYICFGFGITECQFYNSSLFDPDNISDD